MADILDINWVLGVGVNGITWSTFGTATQTDIDQLTTLWFPNNVAQRIQIQNIWARHPSKQGNNCV